MNSIKSSQPPKIKDSEGQENENEEFKEIYVDIQKRFEMLKNREANLRLREENLDKREAIIVSKIYKANKLHGQKDSDIIEADEDSTPLTAEEQEKTNNKYKEMDKMLTEIKNIRKSIKEHLDKTKDISTSEFSTLSYQARYYLSDFISGGK